MCPRSRLRPHASSLWGARDPCAVAPVPFLLSYMYLFVDAPCRDRAGNSGSGFRHPPLEWGAVAHGVRRTLCLVLTLTLRVFQGRVARVHRLFLWGASRGLEPSREEVLERGPADGQAGANDVEVLLGHGVAGGFDVIRGFCGGF